MAGTPAPAVRRALALKLATVALTGWLLLPACGGPVETDDAGAPPVGDRNADTVPPAGDPDVVRPHVEELLRDYDRVADAIVADPGVAADRDELLVQQLLHLFEPGSDHAERRLDAWAANGEAGVSMRPVDDGHLTNESRLDGAIEVVSEDEVRFPTCDEQRYEVLDRQGRVIRRAEHFRRPGQGIAVRVDGEWRLRRLDVFEGTAGCRTEQRRTGE